MRHLIAIISIFACLFLTGCAQVVSRHPMGIENYVASPDAWDGTWLSDDEIIKIKVIDELSGIIKLAWIEQEDNDFKLETITCQIKKGKNGLYLNVSEMPDMELDGCYLWGKVKKENHKIIFWVPNTEDFQEAYEAKKIRAIVEKGEPGASDPQQVRNIKLIDEPKVIIDLIEDNTGKFFEWEKPIVLMKLIQAK